MGISEYKKAVEYSWGTYNQRRVDFWIGKAFGKKDNASKSGKDNKYNVDWTPLNMVAQRLNREKQEKRNRKMTIGNWVEKHYEEVEEGTRV